ncbi:acyltransferase family protein [Chryseobacterium echinoideorum]|uniref:acyltransferase family protein n=1 Tax=Chryseobacterium echinoideorum TaxID=1549648 RepID=UPI0011860959|nr:acyltransferase family protein [Chryseobacterium echinoideorum]
MGRNLSIDVLKIILAFFVVFLHMNFLKESNPVLSYVLVNGLFRVAVPVFLIITGFYFLHIDTTQKLKKWLFRTIVLYIIWMAVYYSFWKSSENVFLTLIFGYHHLWYLVGTFFSGMILYFLRKCSSAILLSIALGLFLIGYVVQILGNLHYFDKENDSLLNNYLMYRNFLFVCLPFLSIGFLIHKEKINLSQIKSSTGVMIFSCALVIAEAYFNYQKISKESTDILLSLFLASPVLFLYGQEKYIKSSSKILATLSTAIYFIHPFLMKSEWFSKIESCKVLVFIAVLIPVSLGLVLINKKIKYLL